MSDGEHGAAEMECAMHQPECDSRYNARYHARHNLARSNQRLAKARTWRRISATQHGVERGATHATVRVVQCATRGAMRRWHNAL